ncbi:class I SAM-dependent methyltransferase [Kribbella sp. NPDC048915]|uniref:class I SAM-dependent methyltransferase n=1 Tax=Kribbella sp. NPDC048915 TaxID=3155148 RepID=UPI0033FCB5EB
MVARALSFGTVAEAYERYRPEYPQELLEFVQAYAGVPIRTALEIGAGTGKATRLFARAGIAVTATDPDAAMLAELRKRVPGVTTVQAPFEDLPSDRSYDLVYSAAALHWTNPDGRWERMAKLVRPGGVFASFAVPSELADPAVREAVRQARTPYVEDEGVPPPDGSSADGPMQWPGTELERSDAFTDVRQSLIPNNLTISADHYIGHLSTISAYLMLQPADRDEVFRRIRLVLPETVEVASEVHLHLARRVP